VASSNAVFPPTTNFQLKSGHGYPPCAGQRHANGMDAVLLQARSFAGAVERKHFLRTQKNPPFPAGFLQQSEKPDLT